MEIIDVIFGMGLMFLIFIIWGLYLAIKKENIKQVELDGSFERKPFCNRCGSYDLRLVNIKEELPWLANRGEEIDFYECNKCRNRFSDEDWVPETI